MVQITVGGGGELESAEADIVQSLVVHHEGLIGVLDQLMERKDSVVGLNNGIGHLGGGDDGESGHHAIGVLLTDLGDQKRTHTGSGTATERVAELEALEAIAAFGLLADNIQDGVDQLSTLGVVTWRMQTFENSNWMKTNRVELCLKISRVPRVQKVPRARGTTFFGNCDFGT